MSEVVLSGQFITLEGVEGCGKSTAAQRLYVELTSEGTPIMLTREPGGSSIGGPLREMLLTHQDIILEAEAEAMIFAADRVQHVREKISPALHNGITVLCDRYLDSSVAYQGYARGLGVERIRDLSLWGTGGLLPDLTVLVDLDPVVGLARKQGDDFNKMEARGLEFHEKVREGFLSLAAAEPERFVVVDGSGTEDEVYALISAAVRSKLSRH